MFIRRHIYVNECTFDDIVDIDTIEDFEYAENLMRINGD